MDLLGALRVAVGALALAWLPGWVWSHALLPTLGRLDRAIVSVALSVTLVALALFVGSAVAGIAVTGAHALWWAAVLCVAGAAAWLVRRRRRGPAR